MRMQTFPATGGNGLGSLIWSCDWSLLLPNEEQLTARSRRTTPDIVLPDLLASPELDKLLEE